MTHRQARIAAWVGVVGVAAGGMWRVEMTARDAQRAAEDVHELVLDFEAERCVVDWERVSDIRRAIPIPGEVIIAVSPNADPTRVAEFRSGVDARIREEYPNPDCDLEAARRRLAD